VVSTTARNRGRTPGRIQSVARAADLLKQLGELGRPASVRELATACDLGRATAWRLLVTLEQAGLVERASPSSGFYVGPAAVIIAAGALQHFERIIRLTRPHLTELTRQTGLTAAVSVVRGEQVLVLDQTDPPSVLCVNWIGKEFPLHTSSPGKLVLARLPPEELDELLSRPLQRLTKKTIATPNALRADLERVRRMKAAISNEEFEEGCVGISAAAGDSAGGIAVIITVTGPAFRMPARRLPTLMAKVQDAARATGVSLGYAGQWALESPGRSAPAAGRP
jgi:DNA-binding IclR family transcriptional regulator